MLDTGIWALIRQRPYDIIANPDESPKAIFISAFDSAPLAPDYDFILHGKGEVFQTGIDALSKLTDGKIHLSISADNVPTKVFTNTKRAEIHSFSGPHPSGNIGVQIHHIDPINKGELVWHINPQDVLIIGKLFMEGIYDASRVIALAGSEVKHPKYYKTLIGASIKPIVENNLKEGNLRLINGNVLSGKTTSEDGFVGFYSHQITVIPEGDHYEFLGWALPGLKKFSMSRTFFSWLMPWKKFQLDTNLNGGHRAFVLSGEYDKVLPMDIHPVYLIKSILAEDIDQMEKLGIYEVSAEDFALCEYVCTSKTNVQEIIHKGLELIRKEMN